MKKKFIITTIVVIVIIAIVMLITYILNNKESNLGNKNNDNNVQIENSLQNNEENTPNSEDEYKDIDVNSEFAKEIHDFVPKFYQIYGAKMSNDYYIYSAIRSLEDKQVPSNNYKFGDEINPGYSYEDVEKEVKNIYGESVQIKISSNFKLPIEYSAESNAFCLTPVSLGSFEEYQIIKELKENKKGFKLIVYALNVEYDISDLDNIYIYTKDTFKLYESKNTSYEDLKNSMVKFRLTGIEVDPTLIINEYEEEIPLMEYELEKLDDRGTKYYVKNIQILDK